LIRPGKNLAGLANKYNSEHLHWHLKTVFGKNLFSNWKKI